MKRILNLKNIPITLVIGFNLFTLLVFYTAPIDWVTDNLFIFFIFAITCQIMIAFGYSLGYKKSLKRNVFSAPLQTFSRKRINFIFFFYIATFLIGYAYHLKFNVFNIKGMINYLMVGILDPHTGYRMALDENRPPTVSWSIYFLISIINQLFFIIGFIKWSQMNLLKKIFFIFFILIDLFFWMGRGTNFGVISMITTLAFASVFKLKFVGTDLKKTLKFFFIIALFLFGSIYIFSYNMTNRSGSDKINFQAFNLGPSKVNENAAIFTLIPKQLQTTYMFVVSYLTQGYYHTCLAFNLDFKPTFFLGSNPASISMGQAFNIDVWENTYMYRLGKEGVDPLVNWHSAYLWYANDISIPCVPILLFFIGYIFGFSWGLSLKSNDFLSKIIFIIVGNMLLYLFANNSYLSSIFYSFMFILPLWYLSRVLRIKLVN